MKKVLFLYLKILFPFFIVSCMGGMEGDTPSRVAITDFNGIEQEEISLTAGMSTRLYSLAYLPTVNGERPVGAAESADFLSDAAFNVAQDDLQNPVVDLQPDGCLLAKKEGNAFIRFSAFSLRRGMLEALVAIRVKALSSQSVTVKSGVSDFSAAELKDSRGKNYGLTIGNKFFFAPETITGALADTQGLDINNITTTAVKKPIVWLDAAGGGFFVGFGITSSGSERLRYAMFNQKGERIAGFFEADTALDIRKVYGGQLRGGLPVTFALSKQKDKDILGLFTFLTNALQPNASATQTSSNVIQAFVPEDGKAIGFPLNVAVDDRMIQFWQDRQGNLNFMIGQYFSNPDPLKPDIVEAVHKLKFVRYNESGVIVENPQGMELDGPQAFALDASLDNPKVIFIKGGKLLFSQRLGGWVLAFGMLAESVDAVVSPRLISNQEDGTLVAAWKKGADIQVQISKDGGGTWLKDPLSISAAASDIELIALPCGGAILLTLEGNSFKMRFVDTLQKTFSNAIELSTNGAKKIKIFRDDYSVRIFFLDNGGNLRMTRIP